jgi:hypothetical protein
MYRIAALSLGVMCVAGCADGLECAEGTTEIAGECRGGITVAPICGPGTHFDSEITMCVPDLPPTRCDEETTQTTVDEDGVAVCVGDKVRGCDTAIACPSPAAGKISVCGQLVDLETREPIAAPGATGVTCPAVPTDDGPCSLELAFYDALTFASDPGTDPLPVDQITIDDCGRYKGVNVDLPFTMSIGVAVDDAPGTSDDYVLTGVALFGESGRQETDVNAYVALHTTDEKWTSSANPPFAPTTFSEKGVYVALFMHNNIPIEGVRVTAGGAIRPADDCYFSDTDKQLTTVDTSLTATGPNGAALLVNSSLGDHGGEGGELAGCTWEGALATAIPGVVFVQEKQLVDELEEPCE